MFGLQNYFPKETFKKNFLRSVSVRAEYAENSKITAAREQFKNLYADVMPRVEDMPSTHINFTNDNVTICNENEDHKLSLRSEDLKREITLTNNFCNYLILGGDTYVNSEELDLHFGKAAVFLNSCGITDIKMLTAKKVNMVHFASSSNGKVKKVNIPRFAPLQQLISPEFLSQLDTIHSINPFIKQNINTLILQDSGYVLTLKYGIDITEVNENGTIHGDIIIDIMIQKQGVKVDNVQAELKVFHQELYNAFRWVLSDYTIKTLNS